jgi:signal transduction histidine kinase
MPPQPGDLCIEIGARQALGRIAIRDRGLGIAGPLQPLIFEPFFSTNSGTGHGLGLTFCRRVVQSAEGTIRVQSELGHGATFVIELPATVSGNRPLAPTDPHLSLP